MTGNNYLNRHIRSRLQAYSTLLSSYNSGKISEQNKDKLIKLSSLIIQDLTNMQIKSKKQKLMDDITVSQQQKM